MRRFKFYQEDDGRWYVDLPEWSGEKESLEMVQGADVLIDYLAEGKTSIELDMSDTYFNGASIMKIIFECKLSEGAYYLVEAYNDKELFHPLWLCDVTKFLFGRFPNKIYFNLIQ
jgi:hypothetical protein